MSQGQSGSGISRVKIFIAVVVIFAAGILFAGLFNVGLSATNEMEFCTSCHSMQVNLEELQETIHYKNASGVRATCADCHVPKPFVPKMIAKVLAYKDVLHEFLGTIDTKEKFDQHRWDMANRVWDKMRASDSRECRSCHAWETMDLSEQDRMARNRHSSARDQGMTCIDCHKGIAHEEPDEPDVEEDVAEK
ncbi:MAG: NapC/NirT family cytochrome c [Gammaproteobacteria bacterium]|nr:NapC/NirT family cytochrome c [Gammaproteobacteria bacterium]